MTSEAYWDFISYKYSLVDSLDGLIVISRFNQNELLPDFIFIRSKTLDAKCSNDLQPIIDNLLLLQKHVKDDRLDKALKDLIEQLSPIKMKSLDGKIEQKISETEIAD